MEHREFKDRLYTQFARLGHAVSTPKRLELLDLLAQGEKTVEQLAEQSCTAIKNTSAHLRVLRQAGLVDFRREGVYVRYRLADEYVAEFLLALQSLGRQRYSEVREVVDAHLERRDEMEPIGPAELRRRLAAGDVTLLDVRPADEFTAGHIAGAISIPVDQLTARAATLPRGKKIVAYCRGPYCVMAVDAVQLLRRRGYRARRLTDGVPGWRARGYPVVRGSRAS
ncbi:MAG TPA: metalloregulator ArsR/SmtB family transcription factor [Gemmatimonadales bacterium]|jgi:rhodanese-related sulfurtransferase|nr:metalloregulator ArsR/SmtB family transcription factor [Gemmatimonadales bacterium]